MTSKIKRMMAATAALIALPALSSCALQQAAEGDDSLTIGLAVANQQADFFNQIRESVQEQGEEIGAEVLVADANGNADTQVSQIQDFITKQVDVIIYIPAGASAASVPIRQAHEAEIPVVTVDRNPEDIPGDTFIATDSVAAAEELGKWLIEETGGEGNLAVIQGQVGTTPEIARDTGFSTALEGSDIKEVARQASEGWHQDEGFDIAQDMLQANPDIDIFFGRADALALGAAQAVRAKGSADDVLVIGFDGDIAGLEAVKNGTLAATVTQQTRLMGRLAVDSAVKLSNGEDVPAEQLQEGVVTTKENVDPFIDEHP